MQPAPNSGKCAGDRRRGRRLSRLYSDRAGGAAVEFAIIAMPFTLLLLAALEVGLVYFANFSLESAAAQGARLIRTGQAQNQSFDAAKFKAEVCKYIAPPVTCSGLKLDVRHYTNFSGAGSDLTNPLDSSGNLKTTFSYDPGAGGDVVVVRAFYEWALKLPAEISFGNMKNGDRVLVATVAFRNEPFQNTTPTK